MIYSEIKWFKNWRISLSDFIRDQLILWLPVKRLPIFLQRIFFGFKVDFIFIVHPRRSQDYFIALPFFLLLRKIISKKKFIKIISCFSPFVLAKVKSNFGINGLVVSSLFLPEILMTEKKRSLAEANKIIRFSIKVSKSSAVIGLGALWPVVTSRGRYFSEYAFRNKIYLTTGHTVTLLSIYLSIKKLISLSEINFRDLKITIIGAGKIGSTLAKILIIKGVKQINLIDTNLSRLKFIKLKLEQMAITTVIKTFKNSPMNCPSLFIDETHLGVCAVSFSRNILTEKDIPRNFIIIDDSRPEGLSRNFEDDSKIVLEGGLIRLPGFFSNYNYGLGVDENVFGCLAEAIMLTMNGCEELKPTIGEIDPDNFHLFLDFMDSYGFSVGEFKISDKIISDERLIKTMSNRVKYLNELLRN